MFTSHSALKRKTPEQGINRAEYIKHLVDEYYTTTDVEAQEQVTANLANFAYDPINWKFLIEAESLELFTELLLLPNEKLVLHGLAGLSNICLDPQANIFITQTNHCAVITKILLESDNIDITLNILGLIYQLLNNTVSHETKLSLLSPYVLRHLHNIRSRFNDKRIFNLVQIIQEDFATRIEIHTTTTDLPKSKCLDNP